MVLSWKAQPSSLTTGNVHFQSTESVGQTLSVARAGSVVSSADCLCRDRPNHILPTVLHPLSDRALDNHKQIFTLTKEIDRL